MLKLRIIESVSQPGTAGKPNEDRFGSNPHCVFVIDGATGLGDRQYVANEPSDAAWLAGYATEYLERNLDARSNPADLFEQLIHSAQQYFVGSLDGGPAPRYSWPSASIAMLKLSGEGLDFVGLGDCTVYLKSDGSQVESFTALENFGSWENDQASRHVKRIGGITKSGILDDQQTLEYLRAIRSLQNTEESDVWTLGLVAEASQNLRQDFISLRSSGIALICSDGFSSLIDTYKKYTPDLLVEAALSNGLGSLMAELRHIEEEEDPKATLYPRFKRSDDATAMLVQLSS